MYDQQRLGSACAYALSDQSLCKSLEQSMTVKLLTEHQLEYLNLKIGCTCSYESTLVKMSYCWKSHDVVLNMHRSYCMIFISSTVSDGMVFVIVM